MGRSDGWNGRAYPLETSTCSFTFHIFCEAISHFVKIENSVDDDAVNLPYNSFIKSLVDVGGFSHGMELVGRRQADLRWCSVFHLSRLKSPSASASFLL